MTLPKTLPEEKTGISFTLAKESRYTFGEEPANRLQKLAWTVVPVRHDIRELKKTTAATATATSLNKRFNEQNNSCARAL